MLSDDFWVLNVDIAGGGDTLNSFSARVLRPQVLHILFCFLVDVTVRILCKRIVIGKSEGIACIDGTMEQ